MPNVDLIAREELHALRECFLRVMRDEPDLRGSRLPTEDR
jgi:hypothetical protein